MSVRTTPQIRRQARQLATTKPWLWFFQLIAEDGKALFFVNLNETVVFQDKTYAPFPIIQSEIVQDTEGTLPTLQVTASNVSRELEQTMRAHNDFRSRPVRIMVAHMYHLHEPPVLDFTLKVLNAVRGRKACTFRLGLPQLMNYAHPRHRFMRARCRFIYKGKFCGYSGALPTCDKTLTGTDGCQVHDNETRYGGQPGIKIQR